MARTLYRDSQTILRLLQNDPAIAPHVAALRAYHPDTARHSVRVAALALDLGIENRLTTQELFWLGTGAILHDRGKTETPIGILAKPERLNPCELETMDDHPRWGYLLLPDMPDPVRRIVIGHHEHQANPYPRHGTERRRHPRNEHDRRTYDQTILDLTQIVAAADMYDALASKRGYKPAHPFAVVTEIMEKEYCGNPSFRRQVLS